MMQRAPGWDDLAWLLQQTDLPVVVKGVCTRRMRPACSLSGRPGSSVSTAGAASMAFPPSHVLPCIRQAVGANYPLLLHSGIQAGSDVFKALALGRMPFWSAAVNLCAGGGRALACAHACACCAKSWKPAWRRWAVRRWPISAAQ